MRENVIALAKLLEGVAPQHSVSMRRAQLVVCGDCGVSLTEIHNHCQWCGGYAQPMPNEKLTRRIN